MKVAKGSATTSSAQSPPPEAPATTPLSQTLSGTQTTKPSPSPSNSSAGVTPSQSLSKPSQISGAPRKISGLVSLQSPPGIETAVQVPASVAVHGVEPVPPTDATSVRPAPDRVDTSEFVVLTPSTKVTVISRVAVFSVAPSEAPATTMTSMFSPAAEGGAVIVRVSPVGPATSALGLHSATVSRSSSVSLGCPMPSQSLS